MNGDKTSVDLVFLHGWGLNASVWDTTRCHLGKQHRLHILDLPGYGRNRWLPDLYSLGNLANWVVETVPPGAIWIGWSLGGLVALRAAINRSEYISKLVLIAATPRFVNSQDWSFGVDSSSIDAFRLMLDEDYHVMLINFFLFQVAGAKTDRKEVRNFAQRIAQRGTPAPDVLKNGLKILAETDLRTDLNKLGLPIHLIHGSEDPLAPLDAAKYLSQELANGQLHTIMGAGHNLFMSHPQSFRNTLKSCLYE